MKKLIIVVIIVLCGQIAQAEKMSSEPGHIEALVFRGSGKHLVYITVDVPDQKCDEQEVAALDPSLFAGTSVFTNLQIALLVFQEIQLIADGCIDAKNAEGPVEDIDKEKSFPRIIDIIFHSK